MRTPLAMPQGNTYHAFFLTYYAYYFTNLLTYYAYWIDDILMTYCAYSAYLLTYCYNFFHFMYSMHIGFILVIFYIFYMFCVQDSFQCLSLLILIIAWSPIQGPSCLLTTTYIHRHCSGFCHKKL